MSFQGALHAVPLFSFKVIRKNAIKIGLFRFNIWRDVIVVLFKKNYYSIQYVNRYIYKMLDM